MDEKQTFLVYASRETKSVNFARFTIEAKNEKDAEKRVLEKLQGSCLSERLTYSEKDHELFHEKNCSCGIDQEVREGKIGVHAETIDEFNEDEVIKSEHLHNE